MCIRDRPLDQFSPFLQWVAYTLPVTHGLRLIQDVMPRGCTTAIWQSYALAGFGVALFVITGLTLRRNMSSA